MDTDIGVEVGVNAHTLNTCQLILPCRNFTEYIMHSEFHHSLLLTALSEHAHATLLEYFT